jgi:hypothetical protein
MIWGTALVGMMDVQLDVARVQLRRRRTRKGEERELRRREAVDESVRGVVDEFEYYWEAYPEDGSFMERLGWVVSLYLSFRGVGRFFEKPFWSVCLCLLTDEFRMELCDTVCPAPAATI